MRTPAATAENTSRRVRAAAIELFARKGFAATGLRELADAAQLTPAALYRYMGSKDDLLVDIMRATIVPLDRCARATVGALTEPEEKLAALVELHVWVHGSLPQATLVADTELRALDGERQREVIRLRDTYERLWRQVVRLGSKSQRFQVEDVTVVTNGLLELCTGIAHWYAPSGRKKLLQLSATHADWALGLLRAVRDGKAVRRSDLDLPSPSDTFRTDLDLVPTEGTVDTSRRGQVRT